VRVLYLCTQTLIVRKDRMDITTAISLLTVNVIVLSIVILALLIIIIILLVKLSKIANNVHQVSKNIAATTEWLSPTKVFSVIGSLFQSFKKK